MWIDSIQLDTTNKLIHDYRHHEKRIHNKFDYNPFDAASYQDRLAYIHQKKFGRQKLADVLVQLNKRWNAPEQTFHNIERLRDSQSVVVIGGQQAGLLTGPLYTIHKIISIIKFAKEKEEELKVPVIPVFWIAGEDHDFDEINHVMLKQQSRMKKYKTLQRVTEKTSLSDLEIDKEITYQWMKRIFEQLDETENTSSIYNTLSNALDDSSTYIDFFARIIMYLFKENGLVLVDSGDPLVREIESDFFKAMIENADAIGEGVYKANQKIRQDGYSISLDVDLTEGHLFYHLNGERILLVRDELGNWVGKQNECKFSTDELLHIADKQPQLLSNNVVTRPLMQEMLFPTLAFLAGPGEVGYWSILKPAFQALDMKMPPVLPRLSLTFIDRKAEKGLNRFGLEAESVISHGVDLERNQWLANQTEPPIEQLVDHVKLSIERAHLPLKELAKNLRSDLGEVAEKNLIYLFNEVDFLQDKLLQALEEKHAIALSEFDYVQAFIHPEGGLQERYWNVVPFLNLYGPQLINELLKPAYRFDEEHYLVYL